MPDVDPGNEAYANGDRIPMTCAEAVTAGEPVTVSGPEEISRTTGSNGFAGIAGIDGETDDEIPVQMAGVTFAVVTSGVTSGNALIPASSGGAALTGDGNAAPGDIVALTDATDGVALIRLP